MAFHPSLHGALLGACTDTGLAIDGTLGIYATLYVRRSRAVTCVAGAAHGFAGRSVQADALGVDCVAPIAELSVHCPCKQERYGCRQVLHGEESVSKGERCWESSDLFEPS
jgi:hypothetical protein